MRVGFLERVAVKRFYHSKGSIKGFYEGRVLGCITLYHVSATELRILMAPLPKLNPKPKGQSLNPTLHPKP